MYVSLSGVTPPVHEAPLGVRKLEVVSRHISPNFLMVLGGGKTGQNLRLISAFGAARGDLTMCDNVMSAFTP